MKHGLILRTLNRIQGKNCALNKRHVRLIQQLLKDTKVQHTVKKIQTKHFNIFVSSKMTIRSYYFAFLVLDLQYLRKYKGTYKNGFRV